MLYSPLVASANIFGLSPMELGIILVLVLILFGPKSLPALGRAMGKGLREFKDASHKFTDAIENADKEEPGKGTAQKSAPTAQLGAERPAGVPKVTPAEGSVAASGTSDRSS
jgi:sec-independent protein translocase protein TatA